MYNPLKDRNMIAALKRTMDAAWFGADVSNRAQAPHILNGEFLIGVNAAGTGTVNMLGVDVNNNAVLGNGSVLGAGPETFILDAATAVSRTAFIADSGYQVAGVKIAFGTASASGTFTIEKLTGTQAPGGGTALLTGALSTAGTANTVLSGTLIATLASLKLAAGDRIGFVFGGTQTGLVGLAVTLSLKPA